MRIGTQTARATQTVDESEENAMKEVTVQVPDDATHVRVEFDLPPPLEEEAPEPMERSAACGFPGCGAGRAERSAFCEEHGTMGKTR